MIRYIVGALYEWRSKLTRRRKSVVRRNYMDREIFTSAILAISKIVV